MKLGRSIFFLVVGVMLICIAVSQCSGKELKIVPGYSIIVPDSVPDARLSDANILFERDHRTGVYLVSTITTEDLKRVNILTIICALTNGDPKIVAISVILPSDDGKASIWCFDMKFITTGKVSGVLEDKSNLTPEEHKILLNTAINHLLTDEM